ncbi:hypothetical protein ZB76_25845 [Salmonella enterica subsp. enterica]|nr:hypothetical protein [Salmonella enterica]EBX6890519.1 hypothetical protein [Salmonella enterica subsp. enterica serovar Kintambo]ECF7044731.1 hypothetical protein [Salmonella enterica subsp. enterica]ECS5446101.1 hypothetical protein [Salmonella enterica subsp. enterica serovar Kintambo]
MYDGIIRQGAAVYATAGCPKGSPFSGASMPDSRIMNSPLNIRGMLNGKPVLRHSPLKVLSKNDAQAHHDASFLLVFLLKQQW